MTSFTALDRTTRRNQRSVRFQRHRHLFFFDGFATCRFSCYLRSPRGRHIGPRLEFHRRYLRATCSAADRYITEMVHGGQFGELRRRGSLIDDEEQLVRLVFTSAQGWSLSLLSRTRMLLFCQPGARLRYSPRVFSLENGISQHVSTYDINHIITRR